MEGLCYGYCVLEQARIREIQYKKKTGSKSSTSSNETERGETPSRINKQEETKPLLNNKKGHWVYNRIYNTFSN